MTAKTKSTEQAARPKRRRNAAATWRAILDSARRAFLRGGYDQVGVREIAAGAGVTAMLINRYFGSKEQLFAEVLAEQMAAPSILTREVSTSPAFSEDLAAALMDRTRAGSAPLDGFLIILRAASSKAGARIARRQIERNHLKQVASALRGGRETERAALVLSVVAGFQMMRQMIGLSALAKADAEVLETLLERVLRDLIEQPMPSSAAETAEP